MADSRSPAENWHSGGEIDQSCTGIIEGIGKCKDSTLDKKRSLEEQKERFQKTAFTVIDMLNNRD